MEGSAANTAGVFLLTPLREGRHTAAAPVNPTSCISTHAPAGGATRGTSCPCLSLCNFYSRPCGRGDARFAHRGRGDRTISTHAPAGGATKPYFLINLIFSLFLLTPLREGRPAAGRDRKKNGRDFYSRPCGRGDRGRSKSRRKGIDFYSRPCGRGDETIDALGQVKNEFLLTPLREGRRTLH